MREAPPPTAPRSPLPSVDGTTLEGALDSRRSRSRSRSTKRSDARAHSPAQEKAPSTGVKSSVLNVDGLEDIFTRFHGELDKWLQGESGKLERSEKRGATARRAIEGCANSVCDFLREHAPATYADLGSNPAGEGFVSQTLPDFLSMVDEDRRALADAKSALKAFAGRRFPINEEHKGDASPLPLLRALLQQLSKDAGGESGGRRRRRRGGGGADAGPAPEPALRSVSCSLSPRR